MFAFLGLRDINFTTITVVLPSIIIALTIHEYAHARMARHFGDPTATNAGRLTLNPLKHIDLLGMLMLIFFGFGWAKPVPINPFFFQGDRRKKIMWVAAAGPLSNLLQALFGTGLLALLNHFAVTLMRMPSLFSYLLQLVSYYMMINLVLMVFNLIPLPPLDGSKVLAGFLPDTQANTLLRFEQYGYVILILLMILGLTNWVISPVVDFFYRLLLKLIGLY